MDPWSPLHDVTHDVTRDLTHDETQEGTPVGRPLLCLSDIHGDLVALESVLDAVKHLDLCGVVAAGDHCLGGPDPFAVWQRLHEVGAHMVRGPSDLALGMLRVKGMSPRNAREEARLVTFLRTQQALGDVVCRRLAELPSTLVFSLDDTSGVMVMHGAPADEYRGLADDEHLEAEVGCVAEDVLVCGSTHRGFVRRFDGDCIGASGSLLVVNAGSVGMSPTLVSAFGAQERSERSAHAVLLVPHSDGRVRAFPRDIAVDPAVRERLLRAG
jgi:predicted phosphodiesterase